MVAVLRQNEAPTRAEFHAAIGERADRWFAACLRITRDPALAEDAVQDALLSAWDKRDQFQHGARLDTWIHRIAINAALQLVRKRRPADFESLDFEIQDTQEGPAESRYQEQVGEALDGALERLSGIERICFVLKHLEQWRLREIADELDCGVGTVKQALFRGVRKLRPALSGIARQ